MTRLASTRKTLISLGFVNKLNRGRKDRSGAEQQRCYLTNSAADFVSNRLAIGDL